MGETVFLGYDRAALDREYNNSAKVANTAEYLARYPAESTRARETLPARLGLRYGPAPGETLDLFLPAGSGPAPVHVFVHGGYWRSLGKADFSFVAQGFQPAGVLVAVIDYGLIPTVDMDELVRQVRASVAWLHRNAAAFGGDPARITLSGHSAGGHLVAMLMSTDWARFAGLPPDVVKAGCGISGLYDLEPIRLSYLNATLGLTMETARRNSPVHLVPAAAGPLLLPVGAREGDEYHRQSEALAAAWRRRGLAVEVMDMAGHDHFSIVTELGSTDTPLVRAILRQMELPRGRHGTGRAMIREVPGRKPRIHPDTWIDPSAEVIGDVIIEQGASVWPGAVLRGDEDNYVRLGRNSNVQDGSILHVTPRFPCLIGDGVTIGHRAVVHACTVKDNARIGIGAVVLNGAVIEETAQVGAGALVPPGKVVPAGWLVMGVPAKPVRQMTPEELEEIRRNATSYVALWRRDYGPRPGSP